MNYLKTFMLIFMLTALFVLVGVAIAGVNGAIIALVIATLVNIFSFWNSDTIVLKMFKAEVANPIKYQEFYDITKKLVSTAQLPMPKLYIMENNVPNAFATGRNPNHSAVAITTGIWNLLSKEELAGVIAHELAHIKNRDTLISTIVAILASSISMLANILLFTTMFRGSNNRSSGIFGIIIAMLAPIIAMIVQMAVSRSREYAADKLGGQICKNPLALARALFKLNTYTQGLHNKVEPTSKEATAAHMFIINPFGNIKRDNLFSTHPSTENRINHLVLLSKAMNIDTSDANVTNIFVTEEVGQAQISDDEGYIKAKKPSDYDIPNNPWR